VPVQDVPVLVVFDRHEHAVAPDVLLQCLILLTPQRRHDLVRGTVLANCKYPFKSKKAPSLKVSAGISHLAIAAGRTGPCGSWPGTGRRARLGEVWAPGSTPWALELTAYVGWLV